MKNILAKHYKLEQLKKQLLELENEKNELLAAKKLLEKNKNRRMYRSMKSILIEVTPDEALDYIRERIELINLLIKKITDEIRILEKE